MIALLFSVVLPSAAQNISLEGSCPDGLTARVTGITPHGRFALLTGAGPGYELVPAGPCAGLQTGLSGITFLGPRIADGAGAWTVSPPLVPTDCTLWVQVVDIATCAMSPARPVDSVGVGRARLVHLVLPGVPRLDVTLNGVPAALPSLSFGGSSDGDGDYTELAPQTLVVEVSNSVTGAPLHSGQQSIQGSDFLTGIYIGTAAVEVDLVVGSDDIAPEPPGAHRLQLFHGAPGLDPVAVRVDSGVFTMPFGFGERSGPMVAAMGEAAVDLDLDGDASADVSFTLQLADGDWSYAYVVPGPMLIHHVRGQDTVAVLPTP